MSFGGALWGANAQALPNAWGRQDGRPGLEGTFLQWTPETLKQESRLWKRELMTAHQAGMRTLIVQWTEYEGHRLFARRLGRRDPLRNLLRLTDRLGWKVYLGLSFESRWWTDWNQADFLAKAAKKSKRLARTLVRRYGRHASWVGWYLPYEFMDSDYAPQTRERLRDFLQHITQYCRRLSVRRQQVAVSVYFHGKFGPFTSAQIFAQLFEGSGVNVLMVQDGGGEHPEWIEGEGESYLDQMEQKFRGSSLRLWGVVESFRKTLVGSEYHRSPQTCEHFQQQLEAARAHAEKIVTFEYFHYLSPRRGPEQRRLWGCYRNRLREF